MQRATVNFIISKSNRRKNLKRFRTQDVGEKGGLERVGGQRKDGSWDTVKWLVSKEMAHIEKGKLVADHKDAKELFDALDSVPKHIEGDVFEAKKLLTINGKSDDIQK